MFFSPSFLQKLADGKIEITASYWPSFLYCQKLYKPNDIESGLLKGYLLLRVRFTFLDMFNGYEHPFRSFATYFVAMVIPQNKAGQSAAISQRSIVCKRSLGVISPMLHARYVISLAFVATSADIHPRQGMLSALKIAGPIGTVPLIWTPSTWPSLIFSRNIRMMSGPLRRWAGGMSKYIFYLVSMLTICGFQAGIWRC